MWDERGRTDEKRGRAEGSRKTRGRRRGGNHEAREGGSGDGRKETGQKPGQSICFTSENLADRKTKTRGARRRGTVGSKTQRARTHTSRGEKSARDKTKRDVIVTGGHRRWPGRGMRVWTRTKHVRWMMGPRPFCTLPFIHTTTVYVHYNTRYYMYTQHE